ncbi:MAG TPA: PDDEXK nuclease domain-containing protein [Steroidobacteraceae bacterium]|nr:PDDEXK nuclease domain-containing protein [Steroidobacteraceae bacterium]
MNYEALIESIQACHRESVGQAYSAVNRYLVLRNWLMGAYVVEYEQNGEDRAAYGSRLLVSLARDLKRCEVPGCSAEMLGRMRSFYRTFPHLGRLIPPSSLTEFLSNSAQATDIPSSPMTESGVGTPKSLSSERILQLSWTHWIELLHIEDTWKRAFYENECLKGRWSVRHLQRQIGSLLYERTGLSTDKKAVIDDARRQGKGATETMADVIRDPYVLEFAGLAERARYRESDLEAALLDHLQRFLLELGTGFCFEARQRRITVGAEHDHIDLVFYHRRLRCHLLIDLKIRDFRHGDAGQMNFYLNYWKANEMDDGDNPPVGLLLCSDRSATRVQYATVGLDHQMFVSRYLVALPSEERLKEWIESDRAAVEMNGEVDPNGVCEPEAVWVKGGVVSGYEDRSANGGACWPHVGEKLGEAVDSYNSVMDSLESRLLVSAWNLRELRAMPEDAVVELAKIDGKTKALPGVHVAWEACYDEATRERSYG